MNKNEKFMKEAFKEALKAKAKDEVPVGAVIVKDDKIIARGHNLREKNQNVIDHAEMITIKKACKKIGSWRLEDCVMYVTLEPCGMCRGAIQQSRIKTAYFGAKDYKANQKFDDQSSTTFIGGILEKESSQLLKDYFKNKRIRIDNKS